MIIITDATVFLIPLHFFFNYLCIVITSLRITSVFVLAEIRSTNPWVLGGMRKIYWPTKHLGTNIRKAPEFVRLFLKSF